MNKVAEATTQTPLPESSEPVETILPTVAGVQEEFARETGAGANGAGDAEEQHEEETEEEPKARRGRKPRTQAPAFDPATIGVGLVILVNSLFERLHWPALRPDESEPLVSTFIAVANKRARSLEKWQEESALLVVVAVIVGNRMLAQKMTEGKVNGKDTGHTAQPAPNE